MAMSTSFFCAPLKTGTLIIGWLQLAFVVLESVGVGSVLANPAALIEYLPQNVRNSIDPEILQGVLIVMLVILIFDAITLAFLIYGAYQNRRGFLIPYIVFFGLQVGLLIYRQLFDLTSSLPMILITGFAVYFLFVVSSFYQQLRSGQQELKNTV